MYLSLFLSQSDVVVALGDALGLALGDALGLGDRLDIYCGVMVYEG